MSGELGGAVNLVLSRCFRLVSPGSTVDCVVSIVVRKVVVSFRVMVGWMTSV